MKTVIKKILDLEKTEDLFSLQYRGFSIWPYYRMYFYYHLNKDLGVLKSSTSGFTKGFKYILKVLTIFNIKKLLEKRDYFVLEHPRSNSDNIDIYTYDIVNEIGREKCSFFSFSENGNINKANDVIILDLVKIVSKVISKITYRIVSNRKFENFTSFIDNFEVNNDKFIVQYKRYYVEFVIQYLFYKILLKVKQPKVVILVVYYYNLPLVMAAKEIGAETVEMQHGIISKYHLGYHYPYYKTDFFPDYLMTFSNFWCTSANYPDTKMIPVGNNFLYTHPENLNKERNTILIISQTTIGDKLKNFVLQNINQLQNYKIFFKLHPNEFIGYKKNYFELLKYININIITNEYNIHDLQNFCEFQIGIYSTAVYEGIERKCKTLLLNDTGIEYMEQLLKDGLAIKIDYGDNLLDKLAIVNEPKDIMFFDKFRKDSLL